MNYKSIFGSATTYTSDFDLFRRLGFKRFSIDDKEYHIVGIYKLPDYNTAEIKVSVMCWPAQFWKFEIKTNEGTYFTLTTGSGSLDDFWATMILFAQGMIGVKRYGKIKEAKP